MLEVSQCRGPVGSAGVNAGRILRGFRRLDSARSGGLGGGGHLLLFVFDPVAVAFEDVDVGVVDETVDHGFDGDAVSEDLGPGGEALVG